MVGEGRSHEPLARSVSNVQPPRTAIIRYINSEQTMCELYSWEIDAIDAKEAMRAGNEQAVGTYLDGAAAILKLLAAWTDHGETARPSWRLKLVSGEQQPNGHLPLKRRTKKVKSGKPSNPATSDS
jgi:hypothetical protein